MRFYLHCAFGVAALFFLLAAAKAPVKSLLQDGDGNYLIVANQVIQQTTPLSSRDLNRLAEVSELGFKTKKWIKKKGIKKMFTKVFTKHTKSKKKAIPSEFEEVFARYRAQDVGDGYFVIDNRVVQKSTPLRREDFQRIQDITKRSKLDDPMVEGVFLIDFVDQTIVKPADADASKEDLAEFAAVMKKYYR